MKRFVYISGLLLIDWWLAGVYLEKIQLDSRGFSSFLAMCGTLIKTGFDRNTPQLWDYWLVIISIQVVLNTLFYSAKYLIAEKEPKDHIKYKILDE